ncbi:MAG: hypothetical protein ACOCV1_05750 [Bacillota bacterium]
MESICKRLYSSQNETYILHIGGYPIFVECNGFLFKIKYLDSIIKYEENNSIELSYLNEAWTSNFFRKYVPRSNWNYPAEKQPEPDTKEKKPEKDKPSYLTDLVQQQASHIVNNIVQSLQNWDPEKYPDFRNDPNVAKHIGALDPSTGGKLPLAKGKQLTVKRPDGREFKIELNMVGWITPITGESGKDVSKEPENKYSDFVQNALLRYNQYVTNNNLPDSQKLNRDQIQQIIAQGDPNNILAKAGIRISSRGEWPRGQ